MFSWWGDIAFGSFALGLGLLYSLGLVIPAFGAKFHGHTWPGKQVDMAKRRQATRAIILQSAAWVVWGAGFVVAGLVERFGQHGSLWYLFGSALRIAGPLLLVIALYQQYRLSRQ
jgi:hypothetical protein